jgi:hypothetical protein
MGKSNSGLQLGSSVAHIIRSLLSVLGGCLAMRPGGAAGIRDALLGAFRPLAKCPQRRMFHVKHFNSNFLLVLMISEVIHRLKREKFPILPKPASADARAPSHVASDRTMMLYDGFRHYLY